jgi:hypothetical protein
MMADLRALEGHKTQADEIEAGNFISTNIFNNDSSNKSKENEE